MNVCFLLCKIHAFSLADGSESDGKGGGVPVLFTFLKRAPRKLFGDP